MKYLILLAVFCMPSSGFTAPPVMFISSGGLIGYCAEPMDNLFRHDNFPTYATGASGIIVLEIITQDKPTGGYSPSLISGIEISVGRWDSASKNCLYDPSFLTTLRVKLLKSQGWNRGGGHPEIYYEYSIPEDLAGSYICFNAHWNDSPWGDLAARPGDPGANEILSNGSPHPMVVKIIPPCSERDVQMVRESYVYNAWSANNWQTALSLADSCLRNGWSSFNMVHYATMASASLGLYDKALELLDRCYHDYGRVSASGDTANQARDYEQIRRQLLDKQQQN